MDEWMNSHQLRNISIVLGGGSQRKTRIKNPTSKQVAGCKVHIMVCSFKFLMLFCSKSAQKYHISEKSCTTNGPTDGRTHPLINMRERIEKEKKKRCMTSIHLPGCSPGAGELFHLPVKFLMVLSRFLDELFKLFEGG